MSIERCMQILTMSMVSKPIVSSTWPLNVYDLSWLMKQHVVIKTDVSNILVLKDNFEDDSQKMTESAVHIGVPAE